MADSSGSQKSGSQGSQIDWTAMEPEFIANLLSLRALGDKYGCSDAAIRKHFNKLGVNRNPKQKIRDKAAELVRKEEVRKADANLKGTVQQQTDIAAKNQADLILNHRGDIQRKRALVEKLYSELLIMTERQGEFADILDHLRKDKDQKWMAKLLDKVSSLDSRIKGVKDLQASFASLISMERQAFGITADDMGDDSPKEGLWQFVAVPAGKKED